jgi:hypothetical protein
MFRLYLLAEGRMAYFGSRGKAQEFFSGSVEIDELESFESTTNEPLRLILVWATLHHAITTSRISTYKR